MTDLLRRPFKGLGEEITVRGNKPLVLINQIITKSGMIAFSSGIVSAVTTVLAFLAWDTFAGQVMCLGSIIVLVICLGAYLKESFIPTNKFRNTLHNRADAIVWAYLESLKRRVNGVPMPMQMSICLSLNDGTTTRLNDRRHVARKLRHR